MKNKNKADIKENCKILKYVANHCKTDIEELKFVIEDDDDLFDFYQDFICDKILADLKKENKKLCKIEDIEISEFNNMLKYRATVLYK